MLGSKTTAKLGRPRQVEDDVVFMAMTTVLLRTGWSRMTVHQIAAELGVTPAALRQRFGAKRDLFLAFYRWATERLKAGVHQLPEGDGPPLDVIATMARLSVAPIETPEQMRNAMSPLTEIGESPEMRRIAAERFAAALTQTTELLERALARGDIVGADPPRLAVQLQNCLIGTSLVWSVTGAGTITDAVTEAVERTLAPYRGPAEETATPMTSKGDHKR